MMRFRHSRAGVLQFSDAAIEAMRAFEQHADDATEAGGLLLGRYLRGGWDLVVDLVTVPQPGDTRTRYSFDRTAEGHQRVINQQWEESGGTVVLLGDWHTHAEPVPTPSHIDLENWRRMMREDLQSDNEACFAVIVGQREIRVWELDRRAMSVTMLVAQERAAA